MAKTKISVSPASAYRTAPLTVRIAYLLMLTSGFLFLADTIAGGAVLHLFPGSGWWILLGAFLAYMSHDSGLLVLRGRPLGKAMGSVFGFGMIALGALLFTGILGESAIGVEVTAAAVTVVGAGIMFMLYMPGTKKYFLAAKLDRMGTRSTIDYSNVDLGEAKPGSWDALKAVEAAEKDK